MVVHEPGAGQPHAPELTVSLRRQGGRTTVSLAGDLDVASAETVRRVAARLAGEGCADVEVDASGLRFLDAAGLGALVHLRLLVGRGGGRLSVTSLPPFQRRVVALAHLEGVLGVR